MVTARYTWNVENLRQGCITHWKRLRPLNLAPVAGILVMVGGISMSFTREGFIGVGFPLIMFGLLFACFRPLTTWQFSRAIRRSPHYGTEMTYTFDPEQIVNSGEGHHSTFIWKKIYSAIVSRDGILLYTNKNLFHWIPATAFESPSDMKTVEGYLKDSGIPTRVL